MIPGTTLEELADLVAQYNEALLCEKVAATNKKRASEQMLAIMKDHQCTELMVGGNRLYVKTWTRESISLPQARAYLSYDMLTQLVQTSSGISLDVRPVRAQ